MKAIYLFEFYAPGDEKQSDWFVDEYHPTEDNYPIVVKYMLREGWFNKKPEALDSIINVTTISKQMIKEVHDSYRGTK